MDQAIWLGIWHSITFPCSQISLSQIHRVGDGNGFYRSLCYNSILQLIAHSSTHFPTIEMQHISMSLLCLIINIQIYFIYNYISLINLCLSYNYQNEFNSRIQTDPQFYQQVGSLLIGANSLYIPSIHCQLPGSKNQLCKKIENISQLIFYE